MKEFSEAGTMETSLTMRETTLTHCGESIAFQILVDQHLRLFAMLARDYGKWNPTSGRPQVPVTDIGFWGGELPDLAEYFHPTTGAENTNLLCNKQQNCGGESCNSSKATSR